MFESRTNVGMRKFKQWLKQMFKARGPLILA